MKLDWKTLAAVLGPALLANVPHADKIAPYVPNIVDGIAEAQLIKGATGPDKRAHVLNILADAASSANLAKGHVAVDPSELQLVGGAAIDTVVGALKIVHNAHQVGILLPPAAASAEQLGAPAGSTGD
jgi:hypothetical protein